MLQVNSLKAELDEARKVHNAYEETLACVDPLRRQAADRLQGAQREPDAVRRAADEQAALDHTLQDQVGAPSLPRSCLDTKAICLHKQLLLLWWFLKVVHEFSPVCQLSAYTRMLPSWFCSTLVAPEILIARIQCGCQANGCVCLTRLQCCGALSPARRTCPRTQ